MAELADARDLKSLGRKAMRVRFPPCPSVVGYEIRGAGIEADPSASGGRKARQSLAVARAAGREGGAKRRESGIPALPRIYAHCNSRN